MVSVSPEWLVGAALAIISAVAAGVLWLANRFGKVESSNQVLTTKVEAVVTDLHDVKVGLKSQDGRIRATELQLATLRGPQAQGEQS